MSDQIPISLCVFFIILHVMLSLIFPFVISNTSKAEEEESLAYGKSTATVQQLLFLTF